MSDYKHAEAFCLMTYAEKGSPAGCDWLQIWNSRDGVTPFVLIHPRTGAELMHVNWRDDQRVPDYVPEVGSYIFIDLHPEKAMQYAWAKVERYWEHPDYPMKEMFDTKKQAAQVMFGDFQEGEPDVVQVTDLIQRRFVKAPDAD